MTYRNTEILTPANSQKSFYGKAKVSTYTSPDSRVDFLTSYNTTVAAVVIAGGKAKMFRLWGGYSATTGKHLAAFHAYECLDWNGKAGWLKVEPATVDSVMEYAESFAKVSA